MKLQLKLTLALVSLVLVTLVINLGVTQYVTKQYFQRFIKEQTIEQKIIITPEGEAIRVKPRKPPMMMIDQGIGTPAGRFLDAMERATFVTTFFALLLALLIGAIVAWYLTRRLDFLRANISKSSKQNVYSPIAVSGTDEIDEVITAYNGLVQKLNAQQDIRKQYFIDLAHEVRTPLTAVKGYIEGLIDGVFRSPDEMYAKIQKEIDRLDHLLADMSRLAKIESDEMILSQQNYDVAEDIEVTSALFFDQAQKKNMTIEITGNAIISADPQKMKQVWINLLDNAVTYGDPNTPITFTIETLLDTCIIRQSNAVHDFDPQHIPKLCERLYRSDSARESHVEQKRHFGVGLSIVKKIIEAHSGTLSINFNEGFLTFEIRF